MLKGVFMKKIITIFLILMLPILMVGCGNKKGEETKLKKIKVAEVTHSIFYAPLYVSHANGYFEDNGLDVEIILTSGANNVAAALMSNDVEIGFCGSEQTIYIYNEGAKDYLVNFAGLTKRDGSFIVSREKIDNFTINDLANKTIVGGRTGVLLLNL